MCPWPLQRWQRPHRCSSSFGVIDQHHMGIMYILLISMGMGGGVIGGVGVHTFMGEGDHWVVSLV